MQPPMAFMESFITGNTNVIGNPTLLDVLGINLVLTTEHETGIPPGATVVARPQVHDQRLSDLVLVANADAWPQAVLLQADAYRIQLPVHPGCDQIGALCLDYEPLSRTRLDERVALQASNGRYVAHFPTSDRERLLFISAMYRPEWKAAAATGPLPIHPIANAFLASRSRRGQPTSPSRSRQELRSRSPGSAISSCSAPSPPFFWGDVGAAIGSHNQ
jgi:hypothetical protein